VSTDAKLAEEIRELEERLLQPDTRHSRTELERLLDDDFLEFGSSGRSFSKVDSLEALPAQPAQCFVIEDFRVRSLAPGIALATYGVRRSERPGGAGACSLRSSLWRHDGTRWRMLFHQGTPSE